jgi:hypothetical protein
MYCMLRDTNGQATIHQICQSTKRVCYKIPQVVPDTLSQQLVLSIIPEHTTTIPDNITYINSIGDINNGDFNIYDTDTYSHFDSDIANNNPNDEELFPNDHDEDQEA